MEFELSNNIHLLNRKPVLNDRPNVVFAQYPLEPKQFHKDLAPYVSAIINKHGLEEWKAAILTHELHRHLVIYSMIGVKMGILAREILSCDLDVLIVESWAGYKPPVSCLSDGLQVSTGASLGRGTISIKDGLVHEPAAIFSKGEKSIRLVLKTFYVNQINAMVSFGSSEFADDSHGYYDYIRQVSIKKWLELDRKNIFEVFEETNHERN